MTLEEVYKFFGSPCAACSAIGFTRAAATYWERKGYIPIRTQKDIEIITKGKLVADKTPSKKSLNEYVFKYHDKKLGLCEVEALYFRKGSSPKITYISPQNNTKKFTVFSAKNLIIKKS